MTLNNVIKKLFKFGIWLSNFMLLQLLWFLFTLVGLGVFGVFPATAAVYQVVYKWITHHTDISIYRTFKSYYKEYFIRSNIVGLIAVGFTLFLYLDLRISILYIQSLIFYYFILLVLFSFLIISLYLYTIQSRYSLSILNTFKQSFLIAFTSPLETLAMVISLIVILVLFWKLPFLAILVGIPLLIAPLVWFAYQACIKVEKKKLNK